MVFFNFYVGIRFFDIRITYVRIGISIGILKYCDIGSVFRYTEYGHPLIKLQKIEGKNEGKLVCYITNAEICDLLTLTRSGYVVDVLRMRVFVSFSD